MMTLEVVKRTTRSYEYPMTQQENYNRLDNCYSKQQHQQKQYQTCNTNNYATNMTFSPNNNKINDYNNCSPTIAILRRHTMYDSLILVKRRAQGRSNAYVLEFPTSFLNDHNQNDPTYNENEIKIPDNENTKIITLYLNGDDPMHINGARAKGLDLEQKEVVHVPLNGLLTRLKAYEQAGISVDNRVYAYAIGLKTADQFFKSSSMKEIQ